MRAVALVAIALAGCEANLPGKPDPKDRPVAPEKVLAFDVIYSRNCAGCHGADGTLGPAPPLNDPLFRAIVPATQLAKILKEGRPGTPMPAFTRRRGGLLTDAQIGLLIHEIKGVRYRIVAKGQAEARIVADPEGIVPRWGLVSPAPDSVPPYLSSEGAGNKARGARLFAQACAFCHGDDGEGIVAAGGNATARSKINDQAFLALISDQALRRIMITGRPDLGMPACTDRSRWPTEARPLTSADLADLGALLRHWRTGAKE